MLMTRPVFSSYEDKVEYGLRVVEENLPFFEGLAEIHPKFKRVLESKDRYKLALLGFIFDNTVGRISEVLRESPENIKKVLVEGKSVLSEATSVHDIAGYDANYLGVVSFLFPTTLASEIVNIQPLEGPTGVIFYKRYITEQAKGKVVAGTELTRSDQTSQGAAEQGIAGDLVVDEQIGTGNGTNTSFNGTLAWTPVVPSTVTITDGTQIITDDGNGGLTGDGSGTINYETGAVAVTFNAAPANGANVTVTYRYENHGNRFMTVKMKLEKKTVSAQSRVLGFQWEAEAQQDLLAYHQIAIEDDVATTLVEEVATEIDSQVLSDLYALANAGVYKEIWDSTPPAGTDPVLYRQTIAFAIRKVYTKIIDAIGRKPANSTAFAVCGADAWHYVQTSGKLEDGKLGGDINVYYSPLVPANSIIVGLKGNDAVTGGYVYAPYRLEVSPAVPAVVDGQTHPFLYVKGILSRDAFAVVNPKFYGLVTVI